MYFHSDTSIYESSVSGIMCAKSRNQNSYNSILCNSLNWQNIQCTLKVLFIGITLYIGSVRIISAIVLYVEQ